MVPEVGPALRIEPGGGLVEEDERRFVDQSESDVEPTALTAGERLDGALVQAGEVEPLGEQGPAPSGLGPGQAVEPGLEFDLLGDPGLGPGGAALWTQPILRRTPWGSVSRSQPATVPVPPVGRSRVVSIRKVVVLPAPLGPRNPTTSPGDTSKSIPLTASTFWPRTVNRRASPRTVIMESFSRPGRRPVDSRRPAGMPAPARGSSGLAIGRRLVLGEALLGLGHVVGGRGVVLGELDAPVATEVDRSLVDPPVVDQVAPQGPDDACLAGQPGEGASGRGTCAADGVDQGFAWPTWVPSRCSQCRVTSPAVRKVCCSARSATST